LLLLKTLKNLRDYKERYFFAIFPGFCPVPGGLVFQERRHYMKEDTELVERLIKEDEGFRKTFDAHKNYDRKIEQMERKQHLTNEEAIEQKRLKKLKLALKDELEMMISKHRSDQL
jgi:uncharacterized protein YdcH (DUF465 family)